MTSYKTVKTDGCDEFCEKRSRFIGYARPVSSVGQANEFIAEIKQKHWDAKHNVYAYVLRDGGTKKFSDDGEPQGTAGVPVLDVIEKSGLCDVCVVVTRYFGGVLLGGGGLVRAYSHAASLAINAAKTVAAEPNIVFKCETDYNFYGRLSPLVSEFGGKIESTDFSDRVRFSFTVPSENEKELKKKITDLSSGKCRPEKIGEKYIFSEI